MSNQPNDTPKEQSKTSTPDTESKEISEKELEQVSGGLGSSTPLPTHHNRD